MRGDRPHDHSAIKHAGQFTPHARGSTRFAVSFLSFPGVYPACAGIDRSGRPAR